MVRRLSFNLGEGTDVKRSPEQPESYVLRGGQAGAARLRLINRVKWPTTEHLLSTAGLRAGMRVLDLGCGGGAVALKLAALVGPEGEVVGIDVDPSILRLAQQEADSSKLPVTFRHLGAEELDEVAAYDFVYSRYLMSHLQHPERALEAMVRALRPGGLLAVEDVFFPGHVCYPLNAAFDRYLQLYGAVVRAKGADPAIGPRLMGMALDAGLSDVQVELIVPIFREGEGKRVAQVTMEHIREAVVGAELATSTEVDAVVTDLKAFADDERTLMSIAPTFQVWGRKALAC
jgi:ubiquinone/menaquinone biosynthesis C-methylase UbiE